VFRYNLYNWGLNDPETVVEIYKCCYLVLSEMVYEGVVNMTDFETVQNFGNRTRVCVDPPSFNAATFQLLLDALISTNNQLEFVVLRESAPYGRSFQAFSDQDPTSINNVINASQFLTNVMGVVTNTSYSAFTSPSVFLNTSRIQISYFNRSYESLQ